MTEADKEIIRRVARILGYFVREENADEFVSFAVHNKEDIHRSDFCWFECEGFDEFFIRKQYNRKA